MCKELWGTLVSFFWIFFHCDRIYIKHRIFHFNYFNRTNLWDYLHHTAVQPSPPCIMSNSFITPNRISVPIQQMLAIPPLLLPGDLYPTSCPSDLPVLNISYKWSMQYLSCCHWLFALSTVPASSVCVVAGVWTLFLLRSHSVPCVGDHISSTHPLIHWWTLGLFPLWRYYE